MHLEEKTALTLTGVVIEDRETKGYTAYLLEMPEVIAEGNTPEEVEALLFENLKTVFEFKREDSANEIKGDNYTTRSFKFALA